MWRTVDVVLLVSLLGFGPCRAISKPRLSWSRPHRRQTSPSVPDDGFYDPHLTDGGNMLTQVPDTYPAGMGEPINVIISAHSDAAVLVDQETDGGLRNYFQSIGFSTECLGTSLGSKQAANLGDGRGYVNETAVIRWDYGNPTVGTCTETVDGGNHFRYWVQDGPDADSGAFFLAASYEKPLNDEHDIAPNGYNNARDWLVGNATQFTWPYPNPLQFYPASPLPHGASMDASDGTGVIAEVPNGQVTGRTSANGYTYQTIATYVTGLLGNTSIGVNHNLTVPENGLQAMDGMVAVLVVSILSEPSNGCVHVFDLFSVCV